MSPPKTSRRSSKIIYSRKELAEARTHVEKWWESSHYSSEDEDHPSDEEEKERYVRQDVRRSRRRAKYAHMRRDWEDYTVIEHLFKKRGQIGNAREWYDCLPSPQQIKTFAEALTVYKRDFDAQFPLSPSIHDSSGSSEAPSSEDPYEKDDRQKDNRARKGIQTWLRYRRDHPQAFGYRPRPTPTEPFDFMSLPVEIRCEILSLLLERDKEVTDVSANATFESYDMVPVDTRLFAVSRQMQEDAKVVFFRSNTIHVHIAPYTLPFFRKNPSPSIQQFRKVHLSIRHYFDAPTKPEMAENLEKVANLLKKCKQLVQLKILQSCSEYDLPRISEHTFRDSLEYFTRVQGVGEVILTDTEHPQDDGCSRIVPSEETMIRLKTIMQSPKTE